EVAAEIRAVVLAREAQVRAEERFVRVRVVGLERVVVVIPEDVSVEGVAARLRDDVDDAARRASELRLVPAGLDVDLLDELVVELLALRAVFDAARVHAVDDEAVLQPRRSVDRDRVCEGLGVGGLRRDSRGDLHDRGVVAPGGDALDRPRIDVRADGRRGRGNDRGLAGDEDLLASRGAQAKVHSGRATERDDDGLLRPGETGESGRDGVFARRKEGEPVGAVGLRDGGLRSWERRSTGLDRGARKRPAALVGHASHDGTCRLCGQRGVEKDQKEREQKVGAESTHGRPPSNEGMLAPARPKSQWPVRESLPWGLRTKSQRGEEQGIVSRASHSGEVSSGESQTGQTPSRMLRMNRGSSQSSSAGRPSSSPSSIPLDSENIPITPSAWDTEGWPTPRDI